MKIAVSADGPTLDAKVANRFNAAKYLLIIDLDTSEYEAVPNPFTTGQHGAGVQAIVLAVSRGAKAVLTGYTSPAVVNQFKSSGIEVLTGMTGTVRDAVEQYKTTSSLKASEIKVESKAVIINKNLLLHATRSSVRQFVNLLPILIGVVLLIGLFKTYITPDIISSIFIGDFFQDTLLGSVIGSVSAGNPITSYVIGGELLREGVNLFAVSAFVIAWVTVGVIQLPAEASILGKRFAITRNVLSFIFTILVAIATVITLRIFT